MLTAMGRDTESQVLARAVKWHSEHRVLINGRKSKALNIDYDPKAKTLNFSPPDVELYLGP